MKIYLADCHAHTTCSFDAKADIDTLCAAAAAQGFDEIAVTDHCECNYKENLFDVDAAYKQVQKARVKYAPLKIKFGIEIGQPLQGLEVAEKALSCDMYDVVLVSNHNIRDTEDFYYLDFRKSAPLPVLMGRYFEELLEVVRWGRFDVLAHMDYPLRYIVRQGISYNLADHKTAIDEILKELIKNGKALEINLSSLNPSGCAAALGRTMPDYNTIRRFLELGGEYITIGSDCHRADLSAENTVRVIKELKLKEITVYNKRIPSKIILNTEC